MNSSQLIERLNRFYDMLGTDKKYSFLIKGKWGIGKTYTYNEFVKEKRNVYYYSLFGITSIEEIEKELIKDIKFNKILQNSLFKKILRWLKSIKVVFKLFYPLILLMNHIKGIPFILNLFKMSPLKNAIEVLSLKDLKFVPKSLVCFDDLERCKIPMEDLMGFIERLKQKTNVIILCNEEEMEKERKGIYEKYKEKVINFKYELDEAIDEVLVNKLEKIKASERGIKKVVEEFKKYGKSNLRILEKLENLMEELSCEMKEFKKLKEPAVDKILKLSFYIICKIELNLSDIYKEMNEDEKKVFRELERYYLGKKGNFQNIEEFFSKDGKMEEIQKIKKRFILLDGKEGKINLKRLEKEILDLSVVDKLSQNETAYLLYDYLNICKKNEEKCDKLITKKLRGLYKNSEKKLSKRSEVYVEKQEVKGLNKVLDILEGEEDEYKKSTLKEKARLFKGIKDIDEIDETYRWCNYIENYDCLKSFFTEVITEREYEVIKNIVFYTQDEKKEEELKKYIGNIDLKNDKLLEGRKDEILNRFFRNNEESSEFFPLEFNE